MTDDVRILIVDDEPLARLRMHHLLRDHADVRICGECGDATEAATAISVILRGEATARGLQKAPIDDFDILHFATHGLTRQDLPDLPEPGLVLAAGPADDGLLSASHIATLPLHARLVVLSACKIGRAHV